MADRDRGQAPVRLRAGVPADLEALCSLERAAFSGDRLSRRSLRRFLQAPTASLLVAESGGHILGYSLVLLPAGSTRARLYSIATAAGARGRGLGGRLLEAAEQAARDRGRAEISLEVRDDNAAAIAFYLHRGYVEQARIPAYYEDGATAIRMRKRLQAAPS
jgi:ribosomal protein S18 acetylase RimI-like enzyme